MSFIPSITKWLAARARQSYKEHLSWPHLSSDRETEATGDPQRQCPIPRPHFHPGPPVLKLIQITHLLEPLGTRAWDSTKDCVSPRPAIKTHTEMEPEAAKAPLGSVRTCILLLCCLFWEADQINFTAVENHANIVEEKAFNSLLLPCMPPPAPPVRALPAF